MRKGKVHYITERRQLMDAVNVVIIDLLMPQKYEWCTELRQVLRKKTYILNYFGHMYVIEFNQGWV